MINPMKLLSFEKMKWIFFSEARFRHKSISGFAWYGLDLVYFYNDHG